MTLVPSALMADALSELAVLTATAESRVLLVEVGSEEMEDRQ